MIKRKQDTVLKVAEGGQLMDFLMAKMGGMARSSVLFIWTAVLNKPAALL